jgi:hypothetical protein
MDTLLTGLGDILRADGIVGLAVVVLFGVLLLAVRQQNSITKMVEDRAQKDDAFNTKLLTLLSDWQTKYAPSLDVSMQVLANRMKDTETFNAQFLVQLQAINPERVIPRIVELHQADEASRTQQVASIITNSDKRAKEAADAVLQPVRNLEMLLGKLLSELNAIQQSGDHEETMNKVNEVLQTQRIILSAIEGLPKSFLPLLAASGVSIGNPPGTEPPVIMKLPETGNLKTKTIAETTNGTKKEEPK